MKLVRNLPARKNKSGNSISWAVFWCDGCEQEVEKQLSHGKRDKSCGCKQYLENKANFKHGMEGTKIYVKWKNMKKRCLNSENKDYSDYGGRGIIICNEWLEFIPFRDWALNNGYADNLEIDRINTNGNYEPSNCRFLTVKESNRNRRYNKLTKELSIQIKEESKNTKLTRKELAKKYNLGLRTLYHLLANETWVN